MDTTELLKKYEAPDPLKQFEAELNEAFKERNAHKLLTKETAEIGLLLINRHQGWEVLNNNWAAIQPIYENDKRHQRLLELIPEDGFKREELKNLLVFFFGAEKAEYVSHAWNRIPFEMYQTGYARRSFRAPNDRELYFLNQLNFLVNTIPQVCVWSYYPDNKRVFYDLSVAEQVRYNFYFQQISLFRLWSAALDLADEKVFRQMEDIIFNKDEIGKVTRQIIKALLNSENEKAWQLVEKLLLAAQRQEGLRQTILEAVDETSVGALKYLLKVIVSNKLARFSSVVRAVDVWAGFGWESEREKTVNSFLEKASEYLEYPDKIPSAVKSTNNIDVYMSLWAQGVYDVEKCAPFLNELYEKGNAEKRALALKFAFETQNSKITIPLYYKALDDSDLMVLAWALYGLRMAFQSNSEKYREHTEYPELFEKLHEIVKKIETKEQTFSGKIFAWTHIAFNRNDALSLMIDLIGENKERLDTVLEYFDEMSVNSREKLTRHILKGFARYSWEDSKEEEKLDDFKRGFAFRLLSARGEFMVRTAFNALQKELFSDDEIASLQNLLKRKGADFRGKIIKLLLRQSDEKLAAATENLLKNGDSEQRLAALDILLQLKKRKRLKTESAKMVAEFKARPKISAKEEILLEQLSETANKKDVSAENGYGFYDVSKSLSPIVKPQIDPKNVYEKRLAKNEYAFSVSFAKVKNELEKLGKIYLENKDFEYETQNWDGSMQSVLLGNSFRNKRYNGTFESKREEFENYPLYEVWEKWFADSSLDAGDLEIISLTAKPKVKDLIPFYGDLMRKEFHNSYYYNNPMYSLINALRGIYPFAERNEFMLGGSARLFASLDAETLKSKPQEKYYYGNYGNGWQTNDAYHAFYHSIDVSALEDRFIEQLWNLAHWRQFSGREENIKHSFPSLIVFCRAFENGIIGKDEFLRGLMRGENMRILSVKKFREKEFDYFARFSFLKPLFENAREHILDIELKRGDTATSVTNLAANLQTIYGAKHFVELLKGLGKTPLNRGYYYYYGNDDVNKQRSFSRLLKNCFPLETDTQKDFDALVKDAKLTEKQLIEASVYAPQWQKFVSAFLKWKGLDSAVWWMHAHTKNSDYREQNAEAESEIAKYSAVDLQDFKDGAVDKDWFLSALKEIGKARWEIVYDAAKYISDGNGHRRARLYADVISGKTKIKEITQRVKTKRDQDYLRVYGLAPLSRSNAEKDVLSRYEYLQKFKKESKQFGAQKQTSEALAIRISMENLARNAGYADPIRLTWAMESKQVQRILSSETEVGLGEIVVKLIIDEEGQAEILTFKGEKMLKAIPPALKKDKKILELGEYKKTLKEQFRRSRSGLEDAMIRGDEFTFSEIENLFAHPVISKHLEKLVFVSGENHGFYKNGKLVSAKNKEFALGESSKIRLAHCVDLFETGEWSDYQRFCFENELKQPFKQIFRELYKPTEDELKEKSISRRYAGHQIQPKKTLALLKTRGWKVDYEEGLQKVFHKEGFTAKMYALADWFSPAEVESPTLETIEFHHLKTYKNVAFEEINPRIFSEVMRDIDLVVSVAHAGGVDAEASHSSIEMRSVLLKETLRLFRLENVEISGNHARIKGKMGDYSIHLGSAVVHKMPGTYLSILPVHSQQRGRIFLPFADDDPKSAELISKVLLLARDKEIQDPTILRQLN